MIAWISPKSRGTNRKVAEKMKELGILVDPDDWRRFRLVTHYWIDDAAVGKSVSAFAKTLS